MLVILKAREPASIVSTMNNADTPDSVVERATAPPFFHSPAIRCCCMVFLGSARPAQHHRVEPARRLDQQRAAGRMDGGKRMARCLAGDHAAFLH
jgi:hypothetical protein